MVRGDVTEVLCGGGAWRMCSDRFLWQAAGSVQSLIDTTRLYTADTCSSSSLSASSFGGRQMLGGLEPAVRASWWWR